jgi:hypothetical protein
MMKRYRSSKVGKSVIENHSISHPLAGRMQLRGINVLDHPHPNPLPSRERGYV